MEARASSSKGLPEGRGKAKGKQRREAKEDHMLGHCLSP